MDPRAVRNTPCRELTGVPNLDAVYLYGSVARGEGGPTSDVDLGFLYTTPPARTLLEQPFQIEADLTAAVGRPVQIVVLNDAPPDLVHRVLSDGELLVERDRGRRIAFEVASRNRYWDLLPILREYRRARETTDEALVAQKLAFIETCVAELRTLGNPDRLERDLKERRFVEHTLQICIQAVQDVASHIVSDERLGEPERNQDLFSGLAERGWITSDLALVLRAAVGFRNVLVHGYTSVDMAVVRDVLENRLSDFEAFVAAVRARMRS